MIFKGHDDVTELSDDTVCSISDAAYATRISHADPM